MKLTWKTVLRTLSSKSNLICDNKIGSNECNSNKTHHRADKRVSWHKLFVVWLRGAQTDTYISHKNSKLVKWLWHWHLCACPSPTNLRSEEGWAVVKVDEALAVMAAPALFQHVISSKQAHGLGVLQVGHSRTFVSLVILVLLCRVRMSQEC